MTTTEAAALFRAIADRLDTVQPPEAFGGAFLVVPPGDGAEAMDGLTVTTTANPVVFWTGLQGQVELAVAQLKSNAERIGRGGRF